MTVTLFLKVQSVVEYKYLSNEQFIILRTVSKSGMLRLSGNHNPFPVLYLSLIHHVRDG